MTKTCKVIDSGLICFARRGSSTTQCIVAHLAMRRSSGPVHALDSRQLRVDLHQPARLRQGAPLRLGAFAEGFFKLLGQALEYFERCVNVKKKHGVRSTETC